MGTRRVSFYLRFLEGFVEVLRFLEGFGGGVLCGWRRGGGVCVFW